MKLNRRDPVQVVVFGYESDFVTTGAGCPSVLSAEQDGLAEWVGESVGYGQRETRHDILATERVVAAKRHRRTHILIVRS